MRPPAFLTLLTAPAKPTVGRCDWYIATKTAVSVTEVKVWMRVRVICKRDCLKTLMAATSAPRVLAAQKLVKQSEGQAQTTFNVTTIFTPCKNNNDKSVSKNNILWTLQTGVEDFYCLARSNSWKVIVNDSSKLLDVSSLFCRHFLLWEMCWKKLAGDISCLALHKAAYNDM